MSGSKRSIFSALLVMLGLGGPAHAAPGVGESAPAFRLQDQKGEWHTLEQYTGQWVVLYFYPKDDTPGCTKEACAFRDNIFAFEDMGAVILGVSLDDVDSHKQFADKYSLPFSLLSDSNAELSTKYGVLRKIGPMKFAKRHSFLIDPAGKVAKHYDSVDPESHTQEVISDLKGMMQADG